MVLMRIDSGYLGNEIVNHYITNARYTLHLFLFFNTIFVSSHMYPENPEGTQIIRGSMNIGYISDPVVFAGRELRATQSNV